jgi:predicted ATP-grasp superfamily ATP-dependent carboligase
LSSSVAVIEGIKLSNSTLPPAIILGGDHNALSIARSLGAAGIEVYAINYPHADVRYSRFCKWINLPESVAIAPESWAAYLLGPESDHLRGAVLLAASDEAIELIAEHRQALSAKFTLDLSNPAAQLCMLDKLCTYRAAEAAGVPTPRFWVAETREQIKELEAELVYPLILKPLLGHKFSKRFSGSYFVAHDFKELLDSFDAVDSAGIRTFLVELIPGPDDRLCSYYTYLDESGRNLINYTKRIIRRYPVNMGSATYHITDDVPRVQELALALLRQVGLLGVANVEFKMDERDGKLKLIECNARFTAADCLLVATGLNLPLFVYNRLTGRAHTAPSSYRLGMRLWKPVGDFLAYRQLNKKGLLTFRAWIRSIMHPQIFPVFRWNDPLPAIVGNTRLIRYAWSRLRLLKLSRKDGAASLQLSRLPQSSTLPSTTIIKSDLSQIEPIIELPRE